jgi:hypothetical protein
VRTPPPAGRPGPLCAAPAGDRRVSRPTWRVYSTSTSMHSARLDSFLSQLRWELVSLWSGCGCEDVCGVRGCRLDGTTNGNRVDSGYPSESGWGQGSALQMAQMARFGFLTVGNCSGHQVTGAQLAVLAAGVGGEGELGKRSFFWGPTGSTQGLKKCCAAVDIPYHGLACTSFLYSACPPWWRVLTCPALRAAACRTATSSADGSHMSLECQCPHVGPMLTVPPCCPEVFQVLLKPPFSGLAWLDTKESGAKRFLTNICPIFLSSCVLGTQAHLQCLAHCNQNPELIKMYSQSASSGPRMFWKRTLSAV